MTFPRTFATRLLLALCLTSSGCASLPRGFSNPLPGWGGSTQAAQPGTREWWKKNQKRAEYVQGEGYRVPGVPGFFDQQGRPMDAPLAEEVLVLDAEEKASSGLLPGLDPKTHYAKAKAAVGLGPDQERAKQAYQKGADLFHEGKYARAAKQFEEAAKRWPNSAIEQQALFALGESYFYDDKYIDARDTYVKFLDNHANSAQVDEVVEKLWAIGQYWEQHHSHDPHWPVTPNLLDKTRPRFDTLGHAVKTYENIQLYDPTGPRADDAIMAIAGIYFRTGRYGDADHYYKLLRQEYPRSEFQFEAHLLGLQSKLRRYQGPDYDGTPLEEAKKLAVQLETQFGGRLTDDERQRLAQTRAEVAREITARDMHMAQLYEKTAHYGAARLYYAEVIKKHPQSPLADEARARLAKIADEPATPQEKLAWLIDLFPENPERSRVARVPELRDGRSETRVASSDSEGTDR